MASDSSPGTFTEQDLRDAVRDGAVSQSAAEAFRSYMVSRSGLGDEEEFHLFRGFNDVFVALASVLLFSGIIWFSGDLGIITTCLLLVAVVVCLSEYFTLRKRLALSSILYVLAFSIAAAAAISTAFWGGPWLESSHVLIWMDPSVKVGSLAGLFCGGLAAALFWWRYRVPIAIAVAVFFLGATLYCAWILFSPLDNPAVGANVVLFVLGIATFAFAMYWDVGDPDRTSLPSDVAFWLHLVAAPSIAHPIFWWVQSGNNSATDWLEATAVVGCYLCLACVAVIVNRRAIMVAATAYLVGAVAWYFEELSTLYSVAIALLLIGSLFLAMAVWWSTIRAVLIRYLPDPVRDLVAPA